MDEHSVARLRGAEGEAALLRAAELVGGSALTAATALRRSGVDAQLAAAALTQAQLRQRATTKFGADANRMLFTRNGLEQATRAIVAHRRAARLVAAGATRVADLGCGVGADTIAFARAGLRVLAVDADPTTVAVAAANVESLGLADLVEVRLADATTIGLDGCDAAFCDPARRAGGRRTFDPAAFSPPWSFVAALIERVPMTVVKLAPGLDHALIPPGVEAEWVSVDGDLVEAALWSGPLAAERHRATVIRSGTAHTLTGSGTATAPPRPGQSYVYEPDDAVVRAHLIAEFADLVSGGLADPRIAYVFADAPRPTAYARCFEVLGEVPFATKRLRAHLRERGIGVLEILKRGVSVEPEQLRRELRLAGPHAASLVLYRHGDTPTALLCRAVEQKIE